MTTTDLKADRDNLVDKISSCQLLEKTKCSSDGHNIRRNTYI